MTGFRGDLAFLSNFSGHPVRMEGYQFSTVENAFQAAKTLDRNLWQLFVHPMCSPADAKQRGRRLDLRSDWEDVKYGVMCRLLASKFTMTSGLADQLVYRTPPALVEANTWHDQVWGDCVCPQHIAEPGQNLLGQALMQLRSYLAGYAAYAPRHLEGWPS
jgi:ribA/ribD-fused uncharacterized protein